MRESLAGAALAVVTGEAGQRLMGELPPMLRRPPHTPGRSPQPASIRLQRAEGRVGRRPIPQGRAAPFRRPAAAGTLGRLWSGCLVPQDGSGGPADHAIPVRTQSAESAESPQLSQHRSSSASNAQP